MRISDWSSDVCSSDLQLARELGLNGTMRVAIQGFGNAGQHIARLLAADGHAIVAVSASNGAVKADGGLDLERLVAAKDGGGSVARTAGRAGQALLPGAALVGGDGDLRVRADGGGYGKGGERTG